MILSGELKRLIDQGVVGVTSNPTIFMKAITGGADYDPLFCKLLDKGLGTAAIYEGLVLPDIADTADMLKPVYDQTSGVDGFISLEVNPKLAYDTEATVAEARRLFKELNRTNVFMKVPATVEGIAAIATLIGEGINVNVTLIFGIDAYEQVAQAYIDGLAIMKARGGDLSKVASVASFFVSRVDSSVDKLLELHRAAGADVDHLLGRAAVANARLAYERFEEIFAEDGPFAELEEAGARVQRPLWASTSAKNPAYRDTMYVDELIGPNTVNTVPPGTLEKWLDHGHCEISIDQDIDKARACVAELTDLGINLHDVTGELRTQGVALFAESYDELLKTSNKRQRLLATG